MQLVLLCLILTACFRFFLSLFVPEQPAIVSRDTKGGDRDVFNEKPTREEQSVAMAQPVSKLGASVGESAVIHTTKGDIVRDSLLFLYPFV